MGGTLPRLSDILDILPSNASISSEAVSFSAISIRDEEAAPISIEKFRRTHVPLLFVPCRVASYQCSCSSSQQCTCASLAIVFGGPALHAPVACLRVWLTPPAPPALREAIAAVWLLCARHEPVRVAIVGSRKYKPLAIVTTFVAALPPQCSVISGAAFGVDSYAAQAARQRGLAVEEIPAQWWQLGKRAGMTRNADIVKRSDILVAFWDGRSPGTQDGIKKARRANIPVFIITPPNPEVIQASLF